jgi:hypothetical protein
MMSFRLKIQLAEALGDDNRWFCSEFYGRDISDDQTLLANKIEFGSYSALVAASGPRAIGKKTACGIVIAPRTLGISSPVLPCGTRLYLNYGTRHVLAPVVSRGPEATGAEFAVTPALVTISDSGTGKIADAWNNPADHFSKLFTEQFAANFVTGAHSARFGVTISQAKWRLTQNYTRDVQPVTFNNGVPSSVTLRVPTDRRNSIKNDSAVFAQDRWTINRATINIGARWDWFITAVDPESLPAGTFNAAQDFPACSDGKNNLAQGCVGRVLNWKDIDPRVGISYDLFGTGRTAIKFSYARYVNGVGLAGASTTDNNNPENTICLSDVRSWPKRSKSGLREGGPFGLNLT